MGHMYESGKVKDTKVNQESRCRSKRPVSSCPGHCNERVCSCGFTRGRNLAVWHSRILILSHQRGSGMIMSDDSVPTVAKFK